LSSGTIVIEVVWWEGEIPVILILEEDKLNLFVKK